MYYLYFSLFFFIFLYLIFVGMFFVDSSSLIFEFVLFPVFSNFSFSFCFDYVSMFFFSVVSLISCVVFLYSKFYMSEYHSTLNLDNSRFFFLLFFFVVSMFFLVFSNSWVVVMIGWDGLGLVSFLLVIYFNNSSSVDSGFITVFTNRVGDCFFILSFVFMFYSGWSSYEFLFNAPMYLLYLIIILGCMTKSAQFPFSSWLPAAMAAPTPVSSLVHSSTLVTAGVYIFFRFNYLLMGAYFFLGVLSLITMVLAGGCANYEKDFKKIVAMSTLSQLGFMVFSVSMGFWLLAFLHVVFHAFFKSCLFLSTGSLMHLLLGDQDSRNFGCLGMSFFSKVLFSMSVISLMGFPFSLGFYSKDSLIGVIFSSGMNFFSLLFFFGCCLTVSYSVRLLSLSFFNFPSFSSEVLLGESFYFLFPVFFLFLFCVFGGNFFFFNFLLPEVFSFIDFFFGVFIVLLGFMFSFFSLENFWLGSFLNSISFLTFLSSSWLSDGCKTLFGYTYDFSWSEIFGGKGFLYFFSSYFKEVYFLYTIHFSSVLVFFLFLFIIFLW